MRDDLTFRINVEISPFGQVHQIATIRFDAASGKGEPRILPGGTAVRELVPVDPPRILSR